MLNKKTIISNIFTYGLMLTLAAGTAIASPNHGTSTEKNPTAKFLKIEQPLSIKTTVTVGGLALIGLELWWFLLSKPKSKKAEFHQGIQEITVTVDGGYEPSLVIVNAGQPVRLNFLRRDPHSCLESIRLPDFHIAKDLPLNQITSVEFTPQKPGTYNFTCGMNMLRGVIEVQQT
jgi:plastocyanin domain-containing protein